MMAYCKARRGTGAPSRPIIGARSLNKATGPVKAFLGMLISRNSRCPVAKRESFAEVIPLNLGDFRPSVTDKKYSVRHVKAKEPMPPLTHIAGIGNRFRNQAISRSRGGAELNASPRPRRGLSRPSYIMTPDAGPVHTKRQRTTK